VKNHEGRSYGEEATSERRVSDLSAQATRTPLRWGEEVTDQITWPDKELIDKVEERYGEDFADALHYAVTLYLNPDVEEDPVNFDYANEEPKWNLELFFRALVGQNRATPEGLAEQYRAVERFRKEE
jgi:hypothetical protein